MSVVKALALSPKDNVATAVANIEANTKVTVKIGKETMEILVKEPIQFGHKFALRRIKAGEEVIKYGEVIGRATKDIEPGCHVHIHNVESIRGKVELIRKKLEEEEKRRGG